MPPPPHLRGPIDHVENVFPASASVAVAAGRRKMVWTVGQRLPPRTLEVSLRATVIFPEFPPEDKDGERDKEGTVEEEDLWSKFCQDQNAYCEVRQ